MSDLNLYLPTIQAQDEAYSKFGHMMFILVPYGNADITTITYSTDGTPIYGGTRQLHPDKLMALFIQLLEAGRAIRMVPELRGHGYETAYAAYIPMPNGGES